MSDFPEYLVEITAYDPVGATVVTLRYSTSGYTTGPADTPANTLYAATVKDPGNFTASLFGNKRTLGKGSTGYGEIVLVNADGALDALLKYGFDGRTVVVKRLANVSAAFSSAVTVLRATVERIDSDAALFEFRLRLYDRRLEFERPIQENVYSGTTTSGGLVGNLANGTADMKDQPKPLNYGTTKNVTPVTVNPFDLIYQIHDGAVQSISAYDGQVALTYVANYGSVALLQAATIPPGKFGTCLAEGLVRLGVATAFQLTCDINEGTFTSDRCASKIVERMLAKMGYTGGSNIDATSFAAFATAASQELGIYIDSAQPGSQVMGAILASVGGYMTTLAGGAIAVGLAPVLGSSTWSLDGNSIENGENLAIVANPDTEKGLPAWKVNVAYGRSYTVQSGSTVAPGASTARRGYARVATRTTTYSSVAVRTTYLLAAELNIETLMVSSVDAANESSRLGALYCVYRQVVEVIVAIIDADAMVLGSTGTVTYNRFGWDAGKLFTVIERKNNFASGEATLTLWG